MNILISVTIFIFAILPKSFAQNSSACGDWESYKESCYKLADRENLHNFADAQKLCQQEGAHLLTIRSKEEQEFVANSLLKQNQIVDSVWLDASYVAADHKIKWTQDGAELGYTNWAEKSPKNLADYCVEIHSEVELAGKWADAPCKKKNLAVCQKAQHWSAEKMQQTLQQVIQSQAEVINELRALQTKQPDSSNSHNNSIPIGFIYVQLPGERAPVEIWPGLNWTDLSQTFAGIFFRVEGGNATKFGTGTQEDNAPHLTQVDYFCRLDDIIKSDVLEEGNAGLVKPIPGQQSSYMRSGYHAVGQSQYYRDSLYFTLSGGEVRPRNLSVKIWKRTG